MRSHQLGRRSEQVASEYLKGKGWTIVAQNYRAGHKEVDIIARKAHTIAFVEVKARTQDGYGSGLEAITWAKRRELAHAARAWIRLHGQPGYEYRFDAIAITWNGSSHLLEHVENAWSVY